MANKTNLAIAVTLIKEGFDKGINSVKQGLDSLKRRVLGFATALAGTTLALGNFLQRLKEVARETNRARIALRNVSERIITSSLAVRGLL